MNVKDILMVICLTLVALFLLVLVFGLFILIAERLYVIEANRLAYKELCAKIETAALGDNEISKADIILIKEAMKEYSLRLYSEE